MKKGDKQEKLNFTPQTLLHEASRVHRSPGVNKSDGIGP